MSKMKIKLSLDVSVEKNREALNLFLTSISEKGKPENEMKVVDAETVSTKEEPKNLPKDKAKASPKKAVEEKAVEEKAVEEKAVEEKGSGITQDQIRLKVQEKVTNHRDSIVSKLGELGSKNVTSLDSSKFEEFYKFLETLS